MTSTLRSNGAAGSSGANCGGRLAARGSRIVSRHVLGTIALGAASVIACGGTTNPSETSSGSTNGTSSSASQASKCDELATAARTELDQAAKRACTKNSDCVGVAFSAKCFDSCTTAIASDQKAAFEQARAKVDGAQCADFDKLGCKLVIPPCVPPTEPACVDGACQ